MHTPSNSMSPLPGLHGMTRHVAFPRGVTQGDALHCNYAPRHHELGQKSPGIQQEQKGRMPSSDR